LVVVEAYVPQFFLSIVCFAMPHMFAPDLFGMQKRSAWASLFFVICAVDAAPEVISGTGGLVRDAPLQLLWDSSNSKCQDEITGQYVSTSECLKPDDRITTMVHPRIAPFLNASLVQAKENAGGLVHNTATSGLSPSMIITPAFDKCLLEFGSAAKCIAHGNTVGHEDGKTCERVHISGEKYEVYTPRLKSGSSFHYGCKDGYGGLVHVACADGKVSAQHFCESCGDIDDDEACEKLPGCQFNTYFYVFTLCKFDPERALRYDTYDVNRAKHDDL